MREAYFYLQVLDGNRPGSWTPFGGISIAQVNDALPPKSRIRVRPEPIRVVLGLTMRDDGKELENNLSQVYGVIVDGQSLVSQKDDLRREFIGRLELLVAGITAQNALLDHFGFCAIVLTKACDNDMQDRMHEEIERILKSKLEDCEAQPYVIDSEGFLAGHLNSELGRFANKVPFALMKGKL